jgi:hypothetical protein
MGECAKAGRDKLTIIAAEISSLGLWIEQLIAESTGKGRQGILPSQAKRSARLLPILMIACLFLSPSASPTAKRK